MTKEELLETKTNIEAAKNEIAKLEGSRETLMEQLKTKWECGNLKEAQQKLELLKKKKETLDEKLAKGLEELELAMEADTDED